MKPRSKSGHRAAAVLACAAMWLSAAAWAEPRTFAEPTRLGTLEVTVFPQARLDGKDVLLAPGARIRNESNLLAVPSTIRGKVPVRYRTDPMGQVLDAWILTEEELRIARDEARRQVRTR
ncbi:MAG: hypothetical protein ACLGII_09320 [Gammaproteobacteria bacterium]